MQTDPKMAEFKDSIRLDENETDEQLLRRMERKLVKKLSLQLGLGLAGAAAVHLISKALDNKFANEDEDADTTDN